MFIVSFINPLPWALYIPRLFELKKAPPYYYYIWENIYPYLTLSQLAPLTFLEIVKSNVWGCSNFLTFLTLTNAPHFRLFIPTAWVLRHTGWMPYFIFTRLNLYLDLLMVIGFWHFIALKKAFNKRKQMIAHFF